ncbi:hypothetical protein L1887_24453 [Cichorium endivia]|nr:hypothetical protein L1887_24453 [Cichorium endivia]
MIVMGRFKECIKKSITYLCPRFYGPVTIHYSRKILGTEIPTCNSFLAAILHGVKKSIAKSLLLNANLTLHGINLLYWISTMPLKGAQGLKLGSRPVKLWCRKIAHTQVAWVR